MDNIQNQDETGVDCGGICVEKWGKWKECGNHNKIHIAINKTSETNHINSKFLITSNQFIKFT